MSRQIKFRVWYGNQMHGEEDAARIIYNNTSKTKLFHSNAVIMQFTGLNDKNGKEIYEGDIVKFKVDPSEAEFTGQFYWPVYGFSIKRNDGWSIPICKIYQTSLEIIGNIYENPELLSPQ